MNISTKAFMRQFMNEDGPLVVDALRSALLNPRDAVKLAAVKVALDYHLKTEAASSGGGALRVVFEDNPTAANTPPGVATSTSRAAEPQVTLPRGPASGESAALTAPSAARPTSDTASTPREAPQPKVTTGEDFAEGIPNARRLEGLYWVGMCPACTTRDALTWTGGARTQVREIERANGCHLSAIVKAASKRIQEKRAAEEPLAPNPRNRLPKALRDTEGNDLYCPSDAEPRFLPPETSED